MAENSREIYMKVEEVCNAGDYRRALQILLEEAGISQIITGEEPIEVIKNYEEIKSRVLH